jgi:FkbH-like protein
MKLVKCVVWDLDMTLWEGVALESDKVRLKPGVRESVLEFDAAGVLQSIASRSDEDTALEMLNRLGVASYFLFPQIAWRDKNISVQLIAEQLNIGLDSIVLMDDDPYERAQVASALPEVECIAPEDLGSLMARVRRQHVTSEGKTRRVTYQAEQARGHAERASGLSRQEFIAQLGLQFSVRRLRPGDLDRARELTLRTSQLNTTGIVYSREELEKLLCDPDHLLLAASLRDCFGDYGTIGLAVLQTTQDVWVLRLLLTSCRVVSRGAGSLLLDDIRRRAYEAGVGLEAEMIPTERNRIMGVTLRLAGFELLPARRGDRIVLSATAAAPPIPQHVTVRSEP